MGGVREGGPDPAEVLGADPDPDLDGVVADAQEGRDRGEVGRDEEGVDDDPSSLVPQDSTSRIDPLGGGGN